MTDTPLTLDVRNLVVELQTEDGPIRPVKGISLTVEAGKTTSLVGESGSGKSQAFLALMGLLAKNGHASGRAMLGDVNLIGMPPRQLDTYRGRDIAMIFQDPMTSLNPYMRVSDQIDAMSTLAVDPFKYLVAPRMLATTLMLPLLVLVADIIGIYGGWLVAVHALDFSGPVFIRNISDFLTASDIVNGLIKASVFGFLISAMGCYYGYTSRGGAQGVGAATRSAVVASAVLILASNYLLTSFFVPLKG